MPKKRKSQLPPNASAKEYQHYNAVLLEEIRSQMSGVIETVEVTGRRLDEKIDSVSAELKQDIKILEMAVQGNTEKLKEHDKRFDEHDKRFDALEKRFDALEKRFDAIETKLDKVVDKVGRHEEDIDRLKSAVFPA